MIKIQKLKKYYGKNRGIEDVSLEIKEGEIFGLIGPNGAGKTTTIRILTGFLNEDSGEAKINGYKLPKDIDKVKESIGYIPGEVNFYGDMRINEFLKFNRNFYKNIDKNYEKELVEILGIDRKKKFKELSLGNKKKVAILQALVHKPKYLILDEPTSGLDPLVQQKFYSLIRNHKKMGCAILFSSHVLSEIEKMCDSFAMIKEGKVIKTGTIEALRDISSRIVTVYGLNNKINDFSFVEKNGAKEFLIKTKDIQAFIKKISEVHFEDIEIKKPDLEEVFLKYYK